MKKIPSNRYLKKICRLCMNSKEIHGKRFCRFIMAYFDKYGNCLYFTQAPKQIEKYEQLSLFDELLK